MHFLKSICVQAANRSNPHAKTPATSDAVALLTKALSEGHAITLSLAAPPRINRVPPLVTACRRAFGLTLVEALVFAELLERGEVEQAPLQDIMSCNGTPATSAHLRVVIAKLRRKLASHDVAIGVLWGQGYAIPAGDRARARKILAGYGEAAIEQAAALLD